MADEDSLCLQIQEESGTPVSTHILLHRSGLVDPFDEDLGQDERPWEVQGLGLHHSNIEQRLYGHHPKAQCCRQSPPLAQGSAPPKLVHSLQPGHPAQTHLAQLQSVCPRLRLPVGIPQGPTSIPGKLDHGNHGRHLYPWQTECGWESLESSGG